MTVGERVKARREELGMSVDTLAEKIGKNRATVYRYEGKGITNMPIGVLIPLAKALSTTPAYLIGWTEDKITPIISKPKSIESSIGTPYNPKIHEIPILGRIAAGLPLYAEQNIEDYTYTDRNGGAEYFALRVQGDSMNAANIPDGSTIIVRKQPEVENGEIAVVQVEKEDATVKCFKKDGNVVQLIPHSYNPKHNIQIYNAKETYIQVIGKVVECKVEF